jgi:hypothetical protein
MLCIYTHTPFLLTFVLPFLLGGGLRQEGSKSYELFSIKNVGRQSAAFQLWRLKKIAQMFLARSEAGNGGMTTCHTA